MDGNQKIPSDLLRNAINQADDGIYIADRDGNIIFAKECMERITRHSQIELTGLSTRVFRSGEMSNYWEKHTTEPRTIFSKSGGASATGGAGGLQEHSDAAELTHLPGDAVCIARSNERNAMEIFTQPVFVTPG